MKAIANYIDKNEKNVALSFEFDGTRQDFLKQSSKHLLDAKIPGQLTILFPHSSIMQAVFKITKRGTYKENGITYPSMYVPYMQVNGEAELLPSGQQYKKCYMTCVHKESNNYKAYAIEPAENGKIICSYGSIDDMAKGNGKTVVYDEDKYWVRYYEKLSKGYVDQSDIVYAENPDETGKPVFPHALYEELYRYSCQMVNDILSSPMKITRRQIEECRSIWNDLGKETTLEGFNRQLEKLIVLSPRRRRPLHENVSKYFAQSPRDFENIIAFEDNLISAMEGASYTKNTGGGPMDNLPIIIEANERVKQTILSTLPAEIASRVETVYKVIDVERQQQFDLYCHEKKITNIQKLWHGSKNENWLSIIRNGLLLNPNAKITGKMFGNGIYFAPNPKKSYGYTSCTGSYWAKGNSSCGYMGLYDTAVGNPYYPSTTWGADAEQQTRSQKKDCLYAKKGNMGLYNDEVVFYDERAISLAYLVKIKS